MGHQLHGQILPKHEGAFKHYAQKMRERFGDIFGKDPESTQVENNVNILHSEIKKQDEVRQYNKMHDNYNNETSTTPITSNTQTDTKSATNILVHSSEEKKPSLLQSVQCLTDTDNAQTGCPLTNETLKVSINIKSHNFNFDDLQPVVNLNIDEKFFFTNDVHSQPCS